MIIDITYFTGKINLPQTGNADGVKEVTAAIEDYEPEYLQKVMCYDLWKAFSDGIEGSGTPDQRWLDLLEGKEFEYRSRNNNWLGFETKPSPIANYVYYKFLEENAQSTQLVGQAAPKTTNADRVNPVPKMIAAWNAMVDMNRTLRDFLKANADTYPEYNSNCRCWHHDTDVFCYKNAHDL